MRVPIYRRFEAEDRMPVFRVFRTSLWGYLADVGRVDPEEPPDFEVAWERQAKLMIHTEETSDQDWVAELDGEVIGWARSVRRDGHVQLTHFFVHPSAQGAGVGRSLLDRTIPPGVGEGRSILATMNQSALSLYLRYGVSFQGVGITFAGTPQTRERTHDLEVRKVESAKDVNVIVDLDSEILGYRRREDIRFLVADRPGFLFMRNGVAVGYAFGSDGVVSGPGGTLEPRDFPAVLSQVEETAAGSGQEEIWFTFPAAASHGVTWALDSGYRIDPFFEALLADTSRIKLDRLMMTQPSFIW